MVSGTSPGSMYLNPTLTVTWHSDRGTQIVFTNNKNLLRSVMHFRGICRVTIVDVQYQYPTPDHDYWPVHFRSFSFLSLFFSFLPTSQIIRQHLLTTNGGEDLFLYCYILTHAFKTLQKKLATSETLLFHIIDSKAQKVCPHITFKVKNQLCRHHEWFGQFYRKSYRKIIVKWFKTSVKVNYPRSPYSICMDFSRHLVP